MQAIIMAAGKGLRMRPLTESVPKPLLKLNDKTILDYTISQLPDEINEVIIVVGYLKDLIKEHVNANFPELNVKFVDEDQLLGTGYAVYACKDLIQERFLVLNGDDLYSKADLENLITVKMGLLIKKLQGTKLQARKTGKVLVDNAGNLVDIIETVIEEEEIVNINIGAYILDGRFFNYELVQIQNNEYGLPQTIAVMARDGVEVKILESDFWLPIGYPEDLEKAKLLFSSQTCPPVPNDTFGRDLGSLSTGRQALQ